MKKLLLNLLLIAMSSALHASYFKNTSEAKIALEKIYTQNFSPQITFGNPVQLDILRDKLPNIQAWNQTVDHIAALVRKAAGKDKTLLSPLNTILDANNKIINTLKIIRHTYAAYKTNENLSEEDLRQLQDLLKDIDQIQLKLNAAEKQLYNFYVLPSKKSAQSLLFTLLSKLEHIILMIQFAIPQFKAHIANNE